MVIIDNAGQAYIVASVDGIDHAWLGTPAKKTANGYVAKAGAKARLVRKAQTRTVQA